MRHLAAGIVAGCLALTAAATPTAAQALDDRLTDLRTAARVEQALDRHEALHAFEYALRVEDGVLTIVGTLPNRALHREALALAGATSGVRRVVDSLAAPEAAPPETPVDSLAKPGAEPAVPEETVPPASSDPVYHTVRRGDTLFEIARQYGVTVADLRRLNDLRSTRIDIGQRIRVK